RPACTGVASNRPASTLRPSSSPAGSTVTKKGKFPDSPFEPRARSAECTGGPAQSKSASIPDRLLLRHRCTPCRVVARSDAGAANVEPHLRGMKQLMKQALACGRRELVERVASRVSKCRAETQNCLELLLWVENNRLPGRLGCCGPPPKPTHAGKAIFLARNPGSDLS